MKKRILCLLITAVMLISVFPFVSVSAATGADIVEEAKKWIETPTPYGHSNGNGGPGTSVDCSGLTLQVYKKFGYTLEWSTTSQARAGTYVDKNSLQPGDIVCFSYSNGNIGHVGIYIGNDTMIHAPGAGKVVKYGNYISTWTYENAGCRLEYGRRLIGTTSSIPTQSSSSTLTGISNPDHIIRYGHSGSAVTELQTALNKLMGAGLVVDGKFGDATLRAVKNFQSKYGLVVDGDAGPNTNRKINELLKGQETPATASIPSGVAVSVSGYDVTVRWNASANASNYDVYLLQEPWGWPDVKYSANTKQTSHTFSNVSVGGYAAFVIARPNTNNQAQSDWFWFEVNEVHRHNYVTKSYEQDHPHKFFEACSCGETRYTGETKKLKNCEECYPHEHDYSTKYKSVHPHKQYKVCDCGDMYYTGKTKKVADCKECYPADEKEKRILKLQIGIPQMSVDGINQEIDPGRGTVPIMANDRTLLPIRAVVESFGAYVLWDEIQEQVTIYTDDITIKLWINSVKATVNGKNYTLDVPPTVMNGRTFMPLRFVAENLGLTVGWNDENQTVTVEGEI